MINDSAILIAFNSWLNVIQARFAWILLGAGFLILSVALLVLMLSRLGHARPLAKCVVLSVYAHFLLLGYAYMINLFHDAGHNGYGPGLSVTLLTESTENDDDTQLWQHSEPISEAEELLPELERQPVDVEMTTSMPIEESRVELDREINLDRLEIPPLLDTPKPSAVDLTKAAPVAAAAIAKSQLKPRRRNPPAVAVDVPAPPPNPLETEIDVPPANPMDDANIQSLTDVETNADQGEIVAANEDRTQAVFTSSRDPVEKLQPAVTASQLDAQQLPRLYQVRANPQRLQQVVEQGGSRDTEQAVSNALAWFARAQSSDGRWSTRAWGGGQETRDFSNVHGTSTGIQADTALTGLALLSYFGAGFTHLNGPYKDTINDGIEFLFRSQSNSTGSLAGPAGRFVAMYCHGIATLALSEAYVLTRDERIRPRLEKAIQFTIQSQNSQTGGWRYVPGDTGDTSQFGWQIMSLLSARSAGLEIPDQTWVRANRFLRRVSLGQDGGLACYTPSRPIASHSMTAEALMCRIFLQGSRSQSAIDEGAGFVARHGLGADPINLYYFYYATISLHQLQDYRWVSWNRALTNKLLETQQTTGKNAGSWNTDTVWGSAGGRVYTTALATLCLEVYYRYLPIYKSHVRTASPRTRASR